MSETPSWIRRNAATLIALIALVVSVIPYAERALSRFEQPRVSINLPHNGSKNVKRSVGAAGTASKIPSASDLWLVVRSGIEGRWYPAARLTTKRNGKWSVPAHYLCPGPGPQDFEVWLVPDVGEGQLLAYMNESRAPQNPPGVNSMPPSAKLEATANINVKRSRC